jgi:hypothetical protein
MTFRKARRVSGSRYGRKAFLKMSRNSAGMPGFSGMRAMASAYRPSISCPPSPPRINLAQP